MKTQYHLAEACKNSFVLVDLLHEKSLSAKQFRQIHACLLQENRDDAIILIKGEALEKKYFQFEMITLGADKNLGAFCGNGSRACAAYVYTYYPEYLKFFIQTEKFTHALFKDTNGLYTTQLSSVNFMPDTNNPLVKPQTLTQENAYYAYPFEDRVLYYADAIEPHLILNEKISDRSLTALACKINQNTDTFPMGINITAYHAKNPRHLHAKTYERGIRRITQSCGTGAACATALHLKGAPGKVTVRYPGGTLQIIHHAAFVELRGAAKITVSKTYCQ